MPEHRVLVGERRLGIDPGSWRRAWSQGAPVEAGVGGRAPLRIGVRELSRDFGRQNGEDPAFAHPFGPFDGEDVAALHILIVVDVLIAGLVMPISPDRCGAYPAGRRVLASILAATTRWGPSSPKRGRRCGWSVAPEQRRPPLPCMPLCQWLKMRLSSRKSNGALVQFVAIGVIHLEVGS